MTWYWDKIDHHLAKCFLNEEEESIRFLHARFGPHGECPVGYWVCTDQAGFSIAQSPEDFEKRFELAEIEKPIVHSFLGPIDKLTDDDKDRLISQLLDQRGRLGYTIRRLRQVVEQDDAP